MSTAAYDQLTTRLHSRPNHPVLITAEHTTTAAALRTQADSWAQRLLHHGLARGDRVAVLTEGTPHAVAVMLGVLAAGLVHVPINPRYRGAELRHIVDDCDAALLLCQQSLADERLTALPQGLPRFALDASSDGPLPQLPDAPVSVPTAPACDDDTALLVYTSGTTGPSKGVQLSLRTIVGNIGALTELWRFCDSDVLSLALPLFHVHGLCIGVFGSLLHGMTMRLHSRFDPAIIVDDFRHGATVFMGVPTMYDRLLHSLDEQPEAAEPLRRARLFTAGSAALRPALLRRFFDHTGHRILERYGMSETLITLSNPYDALRKAGSVGHPVGDIELRVVDDEGHDVAPQQIGELWVRGSFIMSGYWNRPEATAAAFTDGWFRTGDVVTIDTEGYVQIVGRRSVDIIKSGGFKISAPEIEEALREHPAVRDAAVVGVPDSRWGERIAAAVVASEGHSIEPDTLTRWVSERIADYKKPRQLIVVPQLPRNALGKVQKKRLVPQFVRPDDPAR